MDSAIASLSSSISEVCSALESMHSWKRQRKYLGSFSSKEGVMYGVLLGCDNMGIRDWDGLVLVNAFCCNVP